MKNTKLRGFTLAETLIVLTVLGIIAAVSIPNIVHKIQDGIYLNKFMNTYSALDNAIEQIFVIEGPISKWNWSDKSAAQKAEYFSEQLQKYLNHDNKSGISSSYSNLNLTSKNWNPYTSSYRSSSGFSLKNGTGVIIKDYKVEDYFIQIIVDLNGLKKPNRLGYDAFFFYVEPNKGIYTGNVFNAGDKNNCNKNSNATGAANGNTCGQWVMKHKNMNYKYKDVSSQW